MKNALRLAASLAVSALFLWLAFRNVNADEVRRSLGSVSGGCVALYVLSLVLIQGLRSLRWEVLTRPFAPQTQRQAFRISNLGAMFVMVLPLRLGELSRPYFMRKEHGASFVSTMGAVVMERVIDGLLVSLLFFGTMWSLPAPYVVGPQLRTAADLALALFAGVAACIALFLWREDFTKRVMHRLGNPISEKLTGKVIDLIGAFVAGLRTLPNGRAVGAVLGWTLAFWAANGLGLWALMRAFGWPLPAVAGFVLVCVLVIGIMVPAGPGFLGPYQVALVLGLNVFGIEQSDAVAYSLLAYPLNVAVVVGFGLPYVLGPGAVKVGDMVRSAET